MIPGKNEAFDLRNRKSVVAATSTPATNGLPVGGAAGEILAKIDGTDYNAEWIPNFTAQVKHLVKNGSGAAMTKGQVVYISGADGTNMLVSLADADMDATSATTIGLLEQDLAINAHGYVVTEGLLAGLDTSTATAGDPVWLSSTPGDKIYGLTNKPVAPVHLVYLGVVTRAQSNNGEIFISVNNGWELNELHNVLADNAPADNEVLAYDSASTLWKNQTAAEAGLATSTHVHGNVTNTGTLATSVTATNPVKVVITDSGNVLGTLTTTGASATTFLRGDGTWVTPTAGTGTVTSVGLSLPSIFTVTNSPVTTSGTLTATLASQNQQLFLASPTSGSGTPTFRYISTSDFTQYASPTTGQALVAAPVTGGWAWTTFISTYPYIGSFQTTNGSSSAAITLAPATVSTTPANSISIVGGATTNTAGNAGEVYITGGASTTGTGLSSGGDVIIRGGASNTTNATGGNVTINGGLGSVANGNGYVTIGNTTTDGVTIGAPLTVSSGVQGALNLIGSSSPLQANSSAGTAGQVLTSAGSGATPTWTTSTAIRVAANRTTSAGGTALAINTQETATTVTFPSGRFTVAPSVTASTSSTRYVAAVQSVTSTGFTLAVRNVSDATGTTYAWHYQAIEIVAGMGS